MVFGLANAANTVSEPETWMVCLLGVTVVFAGLICIIAIVALMNALTTLKVAKVHAAGLPRQNYITPMAASARTLSTLGITHGIRMQKAYGNSIRKTTSW